MGNLDLKKVFSKRRLWMFIVGAFVLFVFFFDSSSVLDQIGIRREIADLKRQRDYYINKIEEDSVLLEKLKDNSFLEQYARENYLMRHPKDVVYVEE